jgi:uncharacterized membrane protein YfcA
MEFFAIVLTALFVGLTVGLTGVGGGALMTPALILLFQVPPIIAIATDLVFATVTKAVGSVVHGKAGAVDWQTARLMWGGSIPGTILGASTVLLVGSVLGPLMGLLLAAVLLVTSVSLLRSKTASLGRPWSNLKTRFGGSLIGFLVATTSVGAGALGMALLRKRLGDSEPHRLVGTDIVHAIPIALIAGASYGFFGLIDLELLLYMMLGSVPGVILGSSLSGRLGQTLLRRVLGVVLAAAAIGILIKVL